MVQFEIDSFTTGGGGAGVVSGVFQLSGVYQLSGGIVIVSGLFQLSGAGGGGGAGTGLGLADSNFLGSGNSSTTTYFLSHGLGVIPSTIAIVPVLLLPEEQLMYQGTYPYYSNLSCCSKFWRHKALLDCRSK